MTRCTLELCGVLLGVEAARLDQHLCERVAVWTRVAQPATAFSARAVLVRLDDVVDDRVRVLLWAMDVRHARLGFELLLASAAALNVVIFVVLVALR